MALDTRFGLLTQFLENSYASGGLEGKLRRWAKPPSESEVEKCERAIRMVKAALDQDPKLSGMDITVFGKGSYENRTNIPSDSDVDVGVLHNNLYFNEYPPGKSASDFAFSDAAYSFRQFKDDVAHAIRTKFGADDISLGDKAIQVHSNSTRVDADVVPHFKHRRFHADGSYVDGVAIRTDKLQTIYNWPEQDYENAVKKNETTKTRYKSMTRILKNIRGGMDESGYLSAKNIPSYLIACVVWNVPDHLFAGNSYAIMTDQVLRYLVLQTSNLENVKEWGEVNELKYLFRSKQGWTLEQTNIFLKDALKFIEGISE